MRRCQPKGKALRKKHSSMKDSSGRESGALHGATQALSGAKLKRSRPSAQVEVDEESRAPPVGTYEPNTFVRRLRSIGVARWV